MTAVYIDPQTIHNPSAGAKPPATWGDTVRDDIVSLAKPPGVKATRSTAQTISNATETAVQFDAADEWDTDSFHSTTTNNTRITIPTGFGGRYMLVASTVYDSSATGVRITSVKKNGATYLAMDTSPAMSSGTTVVMIAVEAALTAGDYVELFAYQTTGGNLDLQANALNFFQARLVSW